MALDAKAFTEYERTAHNRIAGSYVKNFAPLTSLALDALLDAAGVAAGLCTLDVATGPGVAAAAAQAWGAAATGVDVSAAMIEIARAAHPGISFEVAEVTALPFPSAAFDVVLCNFALGHFPAPETALGECVRVLRPGGGLAFSWWDRPERQRVQGLFREAIAELSLPPPPGLPQGHDTLRFSDPVAFAGLLHDSGLAGVTVQEHRTTHLMPDLETLWQAGMGGMAVTAGAVAAQDAATQARTRAVIGRLAEAYRGPRGYAIPIAFLIGAGRKS
jgi:SAM-dependent methyltransferase